MSFVPLPSLLPLLPLLLSHHPLFVLLQLVAIALFVAIAIVIAIALAAVIIALFDAHQCAPSPPTVIRIHSNGGVGGSLAAAKAVGWRLLRQWQIIIFE